MFGWTAAEVVGQPATLLGLAETDGARMDRRRHLAEYGRWRGEMTVERKDGTEVPVDASVVAIREAEARISLITRACWTTLRMESSLAVEPRVHVDARESGGRSPGDRLMTASRPWLRRAAPSTRTSCA